MIDLDFLWNCEYFSRLRLKEDEILFDEWDEDESLYIIFDGELAVEKRVKHWDSYRTLSYVRTWNIIGEWWLIHNRKKEVRIKSTRPSTLLKIARENFINFVRSYPSESYELLIHIISHTNQRLLKANIEMTANYEISQAIAHIKNFDNTSIEELLHKMKIILSSESVIYVEKNMIVEGYYKLKYLQGVQQNSLWEDLILYFSDNVFSIEALRKQKPVLLGTFTISASIIHGWNIKWYLLISRKSKKYSENEQKLLENAAISFAWVIGHKEILEAEQNKKHIKNI